MITTDPQIRQDGPRPEVIVRRLYPHPLDRVWRAVTLAEHLAAWELFLSGAAEPDITHPVPAVGEELRAPQAPEVVLGTVTRGVAPAPRVRHGPRRTR